MVNMWFVASGRREEEEEGGGGRDIQETSFAKASRHLSKSTTSIKPSYDPTIAIYRLHQGYPGA